MRKEEKQIGLSELFKNTIETNKGILIKVARAYCQNEADRQDLFFITKSLPMQERL